MDRGTLVDDPGEELHALRRELEESRRRVSQAEPLAQLAVLTATHCVEISNPLAFLMANLSYVREELASDRFGAGGQAAQDLREALAEALAGALRIRDIVSAIRNVSMDEPPGEALDIHPLLDAALRVTQQAHRPVRILYLPCYESCARVRASRAGLARAFFHAIHVLFDVCDGGGSGARKVRVRTRDDEDRVVLELGSGLARSSLSPEKARLLEHGPNAVIARHHLVAMGGALEVPRNSPEGYLLRATLPAIPPQPPA